MKKLMFLFLFIAGTAGTLSAQFGSFYYIEPSSTAAESIFDRPRPGKARVNFHFFKALGNARVTLELVSIKQMEHLPNLDSLVQVAKNALVPLADSLKSDGVVRRVDVFPSTKGIQMRIVDHPRPSTYIVQQGELNALKTDMDTLRIKFFATSGKKVTSFVNGSPTGEKQDDQLPGYITIIMGNLEEINAAPANLMQNCMALLRQQITTAYVQKSDAGALYNAYFNLTTGKMFSPTNPRWIRYGRNRGELVPNIYGSLQFARGSFAPSMAAGLRYTYSRSAISQHQLYLMWEPYFFFSRDAGNKLITQRNDFLTLRLIENNEEDRKKGFQFISNLSLGYLVRRKGEWFEPNTIKLGLPGMRSGGLQIEPEFYFNKFFRDFSPALKLTIHYQ